MIIGIQIEIKPDGVWTLELCAELTILLQVAFSTSAVIVTLAAEQSLHLRVSSDACCTGRTVCGLMRWRGAG